MYFLTLKIVVILIITKVKHPFGQFNWDIIFEREDTNNEI
jgi:hypothetical protein